MTPEEFCCCVLAFFVIASFALCAWFCSCRGRNAMEGFRQQQLSKSDLKGLSNAARQIQAKNNVPSKNVLEAIGGANAKIAAAKMQSK